MTMALDAPSAPADTANSGKTPAGVSTDPDTAPDVLPVSFAQKRLWILDQLEPGSSAYLMPAAIRLTGALDEEALRRSLAHLIDRHETLRTAFDQEDGEPVQLIYPAVPLPLESIDLQGLPETDRMAALDTHIHEESARPFDLSHAPLLRARLLKLGAQDHALLLTMHHIISDGWSMGVLMNELSALYEAYRTGQDPALPELEIQYGDFADWQQERLSGERLDALLAWWKDDLAGAPALLSLPTDRPRPVIQTFEGDRETLQIDATTTDALSAFARARGVTLTMLLTSLFGVLLHRLSGQEDVVIGMPVAGRDRAELEPLIGFFINTLPLRVRMGDDPTLADLLQRVRSLSLEALARQELPFEKLVEELRLERDMGYSPVYQAMLTVQNLPPADLSLPGLRIEPFDSGAVAAKVDIALTVSPDQAGTGLSAVFDYNRDLFDRATWTRWTGHFAALIEDMLAGDLDRQISRLALLRPADQAALAGLTGPDRPIPDQPLHDLVLSGLRAAPDKPALSVSSGSALSGAAVIAAVEDRAKAVVQAGIAPGDRVAVCVERGIDLPITLLAVWAAGASYVPMDPLFPPDRLALMLEDSGARAVVVSHVLQDALPSLTEGVLALVLEDLAPAEGSVALPKVAPDAEAYVIYTSGSTGRPKGVVLGQRSVANFLASMAEEPGLSAADTLLAVTTVSFDIAVLELFLPLMVGGHLMVAGAEEAKDAQRLAGVLTQQGITAMQATPATWRMLCARADFMLPNLKAFCGGEVMSGDLADLLLRRCGGGVWNLYGPTETTVWSSVHHITARGLTSGSGGRREADQAQPIGRPIANTILRILDRHGVPVPPGIPGELWIGGDGLARGYHDRPDLTAERFPRDPLDPEAQIYRTGDLALRRPDGVVEFLGRADQQVKLRGFRIELGEIEAALRAQPHVDDAALCLRGQGGDARLEAVLVAAPDATDALDPDALRHALAKSLPAYMVPARFHLVDALPLTPNAKVDRKRLPDLIADQDSVLGGEATVPPRDGTDKQLCRIWAKVLELDSVGIRDNFFTLGGHSLSAIRLIAEVRAVFGVDLPMAALFQAPTVEDFAALVKGEEALLPGGRILRLADGPETALPLFVVPGAGGNPFYLNRLAAEFRGERRVYGFEAPGVDGTSEPLTTVEALAQRYLEEMRRIRPQGPYVLVGHSFGSRVTLEMVRVLIEQGERQPAMLVIDTIAPIIDCHMIIRDKDDAEWMVELAMVASNVLGKPVPLSTTELSGMDEEEQLVLLSARLKAAGWNPPGEGVERLRGLIRVYRASLAVDYMPPYKVPVDVMLYAAYDSRHGKGLTVLVDDVLRGVLARPDWGWEDVITGRVSVHEVPGDHNSVVGDPHVRVLAEGMRAWLADLQS